MPLLNKTKRETAQAHGNEAAHVQSNSEIRPMTQLNKTYADVDVNEQGVPQDAEVPAVGVPVEVEYVAMDMIAGQAYAELQATLEGLKQTVGE